MRPNFYLPSGNCTFVEYQRDSWIVITNCTTYHCAAVGWVISYKLGVNVAYFNNGETELHVPGKGEWRDLTSALPLEDKFNNQKLQRVRTDTK